MAGDDGDVKDDRAASGKRISLDELIGIGEPVKVEGHKGPPHDKESSWATSKGHVRNRVKKEKRKKRHREGFASLPSFKSAPRKGAKPSKSRGDKGPSEEMITYGLLAGVAAVTLALFAGRR
jgi:hypothetical protein